MTTLQLRNEIAVVRHMLEPLDARAAALESEITGALASDRFSPGEIAHARAQKATLDGKRATLRERIQALEAQLPSPARIAAGRAQAEALLEASLRASGAFQEAWAELRRQLEDAQHVASAVLEARASAFRAIAQLQDLRTDLELWDLVIPSEPVASRAEQRLAQLQAAVIRSAAAGYREIDSTVARDLAAARRELGPSVGVPTDEQASLA